MAMKPPVFFHIRNDLRARLGFRQETDGRTQPIGKVVPDGDTIQVNLDGSGSIRFLGIDTAEMTLKGSSLGSQRWRSFFADVARVLDGASLEPELRAHLEGKLGEGTAENQLHHAELGKAALTRMVEEDIAAMGATPETFRMFVEFSYEVFDRYGRFLAFINREQRDAHVPSPRPPSYNERLLEKGAAMPFFIWPNVAPFRDAASVIDAVFPPGSAARVGGTGKLGLARRLVKAAREAGRGVFDPSTPMRLEGFELRYLADGRRPERAVIDLSGRETRLIRPQGYFRVPNPEDRLYVPAEFVPAFVSRGWRLEGW